jgi:hypothetical protein
MLLWEDYTTTHSWERLQRFPDPFAFGCVWPQLRFENFWKNSDLYSYDYSLGRELEDRSKRICKKKQKSSEPSDLCSLGLYHSYYLMLVPDALVQTYFL